jgi:glutamyl-tRNA synthetase
MIRTRFAPSPTGLLHVGGARTALFSWLWARRQGGKFVLRIEDTDRERSTQASVDAILQGMDWLGLDYDEGPFFQTERLERYQEVLQKLEVDGLAYRCYCSKERLEVMREQQRAAGGKPRYDGCCRDGVANPDPAVAPVLRFKNPQSGSVVFDDAVRGRVEIANDELDDLVIARGDGMPTYNFSVVVDDLDMNITHVVRGDDHVNNTPRQLNILDALGGTRPVYAHVPMILGADGQRLSKRHGAVGVTQFRDDGYLPEALLNYLVRLGWSHGDQEIFSREEMIELFDLNAVNRGPSAFDFEKLAWLNQHYMKERDVASLAETFAPHLHSLGIATSDGPDVQVVVGAQRERAKTLVDMAQQSAFYYQDFPSIDEQAAKKHLRPVIAEPLERLAQRLAALKDWTQEAINEAVNEAAESEGLKLGKLAQPLRVAVSGRAATPPIDVTLALVGQERTVRRIGDALVYIAARVAAN